MSTADFKYMTTAEIRENFLSFFESKGCKRYASSSLIPEDPSLLLANAGMNQFKEYYQGTKHMAEIGACSCQKCLRTNDIDNIGDARHLSFFEMLGNFSFGGYTKRDACTWAMEFITGKEHLGLPLERLYFTVFTDDDEAAEIWKSLGVPEDHISRLGEDDNFWAAGPTGPCGPCSEIYFDQGPEFGCGKDTCAPGCDCDRYLEFWNLVFTQFDRQEDGSMPELPHRNIDTGMGLERISAIMQHAHSNYEGDIMASLIKLGEKICHKTYGQDTKTDTSLRILADHSRAVTFMIADGILPSNEGRGYVLRRLLRRAVYHSRLLGVDAAFMTNYAHEVEALLGDTYPELKEQAALIDGILNAEEERFGATLDTGEAMLTRELERLSAGDTLSGTVAFTLHDTYGFPIDLTREICAEKDVDVDMDAFQREMEAQRARGRENADMDAWGQANTIWGSLSQSLPATEFVGYEENSSEAKVLALVVEGQKVEEASAGTELEIVLDKTPFYAEMGGQIGDTGTLESAGARLRVSNTQARQGLYVHTAKVIEGTIHAQESVTAEIDAGRRELIRRNHTATHLLDAALKEVLGDHVHQAGSLVAPDRLRFDFTHFEALTQDELAEIEGLINREIFAAKPVVTNIMSLEDAKASGAVALFGEKYGDVVRVVSAGTEDVPFSRELCGGTHARNTAELGFFKIVSESSVGSNARRIEAVTSAGAVQYVDEKLSLLQDASQALKTRDTDLVSRIAQLTSELKELNRKLEAATTGANSNQVADAFAKAQELDGYKLVAAKLENLDGKGLRSAWDGLRDLADGAPLAVVLGSVTPEGKVALLAAATESAVAAGFNAGAIIKQISQRVGGRGGGKPNMAQAGGSDGAGIEPALAEAREILGV